MDLRTFLPHCDSCHGLLDFSTMRTPNCGHFLCVHCLPPQLTICPLDGYSEISPMSTDRRELAQSKALEIAQIIDAEERPLQDLALLCGYFTRAVQAAFRHSQPERVAVDVQVASAISAVEIPWENGEVEVPAKSPVLHICPVCIEFRVDSWDSLKLHLEDRHIVKRPIHHTAMPPHTQSVEEQSLISLQVNADLPTLQREVYQLFEEANRDYRTLYNAFSAEVQVIWFKLLELFVTCEVDIFGSTRTEFYCLGTEFDVAVKVDPVQLVFPQYTHAFSQISTERQKALLPFAARMVLDKAAAALERAMYAVRGVTGGSRPRCKVEKGSVCVHLTVADDLGPSSSELLHAYGQLHSDVTRLLGCAVKYWAKSRGLSTSLTCYMCLVMLIAFLQQCTHAYPFLVPKVGMLSEEYISQVPESQLRDGLSLSAPHLLIEFFRYYAINFDWHRNYISITEQDISAKMRRRWQTSCIAIQDPFEEGANLAHV